MNMYLQVVNVISAVGICFWVDKFGRRPLFRISIVGMMICYISMTIGLARYDIGDGTKNQDAARAFLVFMFAYYVCYNLAFSGMLVSYSCEILPYSLRARGLTVMFFCVNSSLFFNSYVNPVAIEKIGWKYYIVYCCWLAFEVAVVFRYYIETKGTPLEEITKLFDGDQAVLGGAGAGLEKGDDFATESMKEGNGHATEETVEVKL
jgi:MFS family permease